MQVPAYLSPAEQRFKHINSLYAEPFEWTSLVA